MRKVKKGKCPDLVPNKSHVVVYTRHKWDEDGECLRCGKERNPAAGTKMFRPIVTKQKT